MNPLTDFYIAALSSPYFWIFAAFDLVVTAFALRVVVLRRRRRRAVDRRIDEIACEAAVETVLAEIETGRFFAETAETRARAAGH